MIIYFTHLINYFESIYTKENFLQIVKLFTKSYFRIIRIRSIKQVVNNHIPIIIDSLRNSKKLEPRVIRKVKSLKNKLTNIIRILNIIPSLKLIKKNKMYTSF